MTDLSGIVGRKALVGLAVALLLAACGDRPTTDDLRGYTKAPLEEPGLDVTQEPAAPMTGMERPVGIVKLDANGAVASPDSQLPLPADTVLRLRLDTATTSKGSN
jgi:hypothetical protein